MKILNYNVLCFRIFAMKIIHLYNIMDNKRLPEKLMKQYYFMHRENCKCNVFSIDWNLFYNVWYYIFNNERGVFLGIFFVFFIFVTRVAKNLGQQKTSDKNLSKTEAHCTLPSFIISLLVVRSRQMKSHYTPCSS